MLDVMLGPGRFARPRRAVLGAATAFVFAEIAAAPGPAAVLGRFRTACYLRLPAGAVIALVTADATVPPIGVVLPATSHQLPLDDIDELAGPVIIQAGELLIGSLAITVCPTRRAVLPRVGVARGASIAHSYRLVRQHRAYAEVLSLAGLPTEQLLGRGSGLTPAGDDLLCGRLAGCRLFGVDDAATRHRIEQALLRRPRATTDLSRALLLRALAGEGLSQLTDFGYALAHDGAAVPEAFQALAQIGHSSGLALAMGVLAAAQSAEQ